LIFFPLAILLEEPVPSPASLAWSAAAGLSGAIGIAAFYRALSTGAAAMVAPTAGVIGAALPVLVATILDGIPSTLHAVGIAAGLAGIWLVSKPTDGSARASAAEFRLALLAGLGFGGFFVFIAQLEAGLVFAPLVVAKLAALGFGTIVMLARGLPFPRPAANPLALLTGVLDAGGNLFYLLAQQYTTLAIAAVLSSMYPVMTIYLSRMLLQERVVRRQVAGIALCLAAVVAIAL
jgi:drug/metabolite transporter (DMT)-like permease